jgi:hypothetical protein
MRQTALITATALVTAIAAIGGLVVINANSSLHSTTSPASVSIDVMQMMKEAQNLPEQQYDAQ